MTYNTITPIGLTIEALDMLGKAVPPFVPFSVRCPQFIELKDGTLLYFFDAKYYEQSDEAESCKVMLRSHDGGQTWGEARVLEYDSLPFFLGGLPLYDAVRDTLIYFARSRHFKPEFAEDRLVTEQDQVLGRVDERFWVAKSRDGGLSWTEFCEVFLDAPADWRVQHCPSPGCGIQLLHQKDPAKNGRLVVPANHIIRPDDGPTSFGYHLLVSDDGGDSWRMGAVQNVGNGNECLAVERADGSLLVNARTLGGDPANLRLQSVSTDGGDSFSVGWPVETLYDPCCHAGFACAAVDGQEYLFFTAPSGELDPPWEFLNVVSRWGKREAMVLHMSADGGQTYRPLLQLSERGEFAAYSALCATADGKLHCAWESGPQIGLYRDIRYQVFDLKALVRQ